MTKTETKPEVQVVDSGEAAKYWALDHISDARLAAEGVTRQQLKDDSELFNKLFPKLIEQDIALVTRARELTAKSEARGVKSTETYR